MPIGFEGKRKKLGDNSELARGCGNEQKVSSMPSKTAAIEISSSGALISLIKDYGPVNLPTFLWIKCTVAVLQFFSILSMYRCIGMSGHSNLAEAV